MRRILVSLCLALFLCLVFSPTLVHAGGPVRPNPPKGGEYVQTFLDLLFQGIAAWMEGEVEPQP